MWVLTLLGKTGQDTDLTPDFPTITPTPVPVGKVEG